MSSPNNPKNTGLSITVIVTTITVIGGVIVAAINNFDKIVAKPQNNTTSIPTDTVVKKDTPQNQLPEYITASFCDAVKTLSHDAANDFNNSKRKIKSSDEVEDIWASVYKVKDTEIEIIFDKDEALSQADLEIYHGNDSTQAIELFNRYVTILDACLVAKKSELYQNQVSPERDNRKSYWVEFRGENYGVELWLVIHRNEQSRSSTTVTILKKGKI